MAVDIFDGRGIYCCSDFVQHSHKTLRGAWWCGRIQYWLVRLQLVPGSRWLKRHYGR